MTPARLERKQGAQVFVVVGVCGLIGAFARRVDSDSLSSSEMVLDTDVVDRIVPRQPTDDECMKCKLSSDAERKQFNPCKQGVVDADTAWCERTLCVVFAPNDNFDEAICKRTYSQADIRHGYLPGKPIPELGDDQPHQVIMMHTTQGRELFKQAIEAGTDWPYYQIPGFARTEAHWSYCGISTSTMALNYLQVPPPFYQGTWRYWSERKLLDLYPRMAEKVDRSPPGSMIPELTCMFEDLGVQVEAQSHGTEAQFRNALRRAMSADAFKQTFLIANYHRQHVSQGGSGHYVPIAALSGDWVLIYDVAQYKYPVHWVRVKDLVRGMDTVDSDTGAPRGWMLLSGPSEEAIQSGLLEYGDLRNCAIPRPGVDPWNSSDRGLTAQEVQTVLTSARATWW